eukprot:gnl/MRDRNA2_/MRDRNA2_84283_c0_seq1.p1 gnl/MRDRNA2_/MRDRNA2_84283_c0~~gnl/MRDRNA2_/MRDRNA2_84283_c0_seq1.p1  ORF type:complete len:209 (-),score=49.76 gnl/MRDRNA2_/MRDRNA2_84283_c0_seq1:279-905(-)
MSHTTFVLAVALATFAEGNVMPWQKNPALRSLMQQITDSTGRRLQAAMMTDECKAKCPKVMDFLTAVGEAGDDMAKITEKACAHTDTLTCIMSNDDCKDEGTASMEPIICMCACPDAAAAGEIGETPTKDQCKAIGCILNADASKCGAMQTMVDSDPEAKKSVESCNANHADEMKGSSGGGDGDPSTDSGTKAVPAALMVVIVSAFFA